MNTEHEVRRGVRMESPGGELHIVEDGRGICEMGFGPSPDGDVVWEETPLLREALRQLREYFAGGRREFDLPLSTCGTEFQERCWAALREIPYGETRTYGQIAVRVGNPKACRAVGMANHNNPVAIVTPCHRVIGAGGKLTGYAGGIDKKEMLLRLEGVIK